MRLRLVCIEGTGPNRQYYCSQISLYPEYLPQCNRVTIRSLARVPVFDELKIVHSTCPALSMISSLSLFTGYCHDQVTFDELSEKMSTVISKSGPFERWFSFGPTFILPEDVSHLESLLVFASVNRENYEESQNGLKTLFNYGTSLYGQAVDFHLSATDNRDLTDCIARYHIRATPQTSFMEERPVKCTDDKGNFLFDSRTISLAPALSLSSRWHYAVSIRPIVHESPETLRARPDDMVPKPKQVDEAEPNFFFGSKRELEDEAALASKRPRPGYICRICQSTEHFIADCPKKKAYICNICREPGHRIQDCPCKGAKDNPNTSAPDSCWFCLSNPALRKHLIIDIGEECYLTLAKGGIIPEHFLVIPIEHLSSTSALPSTCLDELKNGVSRIAKGLGQHLIVFCHRHNPSHHLHIQAVAIPTDKASDFPPFAEEYFSSKDLKALPNGNLAKDTSEFLLFTTDPSGNNTGEWSIALKLDEYFPSTFGRELIATFLDMKERIDWRKSPLTEADEKKLVAEFKHKL